MRTYVFISLLLAATAASAHHKNLVGAETSSTSSVQISHAYTDGKCRFKLKLVPKQEYDDKTYMFYATKNNPNGWGFSFDCNAGASKSDVYDQIGAKPTDGKWIDLDTKKPFKPKQHFKLIKFSGKNWKGIATAVDQIYYAPPDRRSRFFNFCLIENDGPQALCGRTQIRGVTQPDSASKLPKIMAVLKTIVFVDVVASQTTRSSSSSR